MAIFTGTAGADSLVGADGEADTFRFTPANLAAEDTVLGGGGTALDILQLIAGGTVAAGAFANVSGIERIQSANAGNSYVLTQALVAGATGTFEARGGTGADYVDGSAVTSAVLFVAGGGADTMIGGGGNDTFSVLAAFAGARRFEGGAGNDTLVTNPASWSGSDLFLGGAGKDRITFNASGTITAAMLAGLQSVEEIQFGNALSLDLTLNDLAVAQAGGALTVLGGAQGAQRVDASALGIVHVSYFAGTGADTFLGGLGDDRFEVTEAASTGHLGGGNDVLRLLSKLASGIVVDGGAGHDVVELFAGGVWDLTGLSNFEEVELLAPSTLTLPGTAGFRVLGSDRNDTVTLGGPGQTFFGFAGDDTVVVTPQTLVGAVLNGGSQAGADTLRLGAAGSYDLRRAAITGFEKIDQVAVPGGFSIIHLPATPFDVVLRHSTSIVLGAHAMQTVAGSARNDAFTLGAAGQFVDGGAGSDTFVATAAQLAAGTVLAGGPGTDELWISGGGTVDLGTGALLVGIETIELKDPTHLITDPVGSPAVLGSSGADTVTAGGPGLGGDLGGGNDVLRVNLTHLGAAGAPMSAGAGADTLIAVDDSDPFFQALLSSRFTGFERIDLSGLTGAQVTLEGAEARHVLLGASNVFLFGGAGDDVVEIGGTLANASGGDGNDTMIQTAAPSATQALIGNGGDDLIIYDRSAAGSVATTMPTTWAAETVRLLGAHAFTSNFSAGIAFLGDPAIGNSITLRGNNQSFLGGSGADTMTASSGLGTTLAGGEGADLYLIDTAHQALWNTPGRAILDTETAFVLNVIRVQGSGSLTLDFHDHLVQHIDRIDLNAPNAAISLTLTDAMAASADANNDGQGGDFHVETQGFTPIGIRVDASAFAAGRALRVGGPLGGDDTLIGGAGADSIGGSGGADFIVGGGGADSLLGGNGNDTISAGPGADTIIGGSGGDVIDLAEASQGADVLSFSSIGDGSVDIDDNAGVSQSSADSISGFNALVDKVQLSRAGLGLGNGGVASVPANGAWNIGSNAVFVFESDSFLSDTLNGNNFASLGAIAHAINTSNGAGFGSSAGRTVALAISNPSVNSPRATGLYVWTDVDGDSFLEASDVVRLLGVFHGVTANEMGFGSAIQIIA